MVDVLLHKENSKSFFKKLLELINKYGKFAEYKNLKISCISVY